MWKWLACPYTQRRGGKAEVLCLFGNQCLCKKGRVCQRINSQQYLPHFEIINPGNDSAFGCC